MLIALLCLVAYFIISCNHPDIKGVAYNSNDTLNLLIQWHQTDNPRRNKELSETVCTNLGNEHISKVYFLQREDWSLQDIISQLNCGLSSDFIQRKARVVKLERDSIPVAKFNNSSSSFYIDHDHHTGTLSFQEAFEFANKHLSNQLVILANLDISFDKSISDLPHLTNFPGNLAYFVSRYEHPSNEEMGIGTQCGPKYIGSHDVFIFKSPLPRHLIESCRGLPLGVSGTENVAMWHFQNLGYRVENPCDRIKTWHNHASGSRKHTDYELNNPLISALCYPPMDKVMS